MAKSEPESKPPEKSRRWRQLVYDFSQYTTMHGVRFVGANSRFILRRIGWFIITGFAMGIFLFYLVDRVSFYLSFQKSVNVEVNYIDELDFPAVTICNQNQFKLTSATSGGYYNQVRSISQSSSSGGTVECQGSEFLCDNKCIVMSRRCDGIADCLDQTDEDPDMCGCTHLGITGSETFHNVIDDTILDHVFVIDQSQEFSGRAVYFSSTGDSDVMTYILYDNTTQKWFFSLSMDHNRDDIILETSEANVTADTPGAYNGLWTYLDGQVDLDITCTAPQPAEQTLESLVTSPADVVSLKDMYEHGAHQMSDMIQGCSWKGRPCSTSAFEVVDTDMGRCFTYKPKEKIEQSGPGFGLGFTVNIQQYEYTKNTQEGVGLQVLLHNPDESPMMAERSFAISPGLYSLVTIDRTEVENLKPPWGQCEARELQYYEAYSVNSCNLDCLNERIRADCRCKDIYMPEPRELEGADVNFCTLDEYTNCWKPKLDELRLVGNYCSCATPCEEVLFVPSLSFSSISSDQDLLQGEDLREMILMRDNLIHAREVTYRIHPDKYLESMRVMTKLILQTKKTQTRVKSVESQINEELDEVRGLMGLVNADCLWLTKEQQKLIDQLNMYLQPLIEDIYQSVENNVHVYAKELPYRLREVYDCWDNGHCGYENCHAEYTCTTAETKATIVCRTDPCTGGITAADLYTPVSSKTCTVDTICEPSESKTWQAMARPFIATLQSSLDILKNTLRSNETLEKIQHILQNGTLEFILQPDYMEPLAPYIRAQCDWCFSANTSVMQLLLDTLREGLLTEVPVLLNDVNVLLEELNVTYLYNGKFLNSGTNREEVFDFLTELSNTTARILSTIENQIKQPTREVITMMSELLRLVTPRCGSEMRKLYNEYIDEHARMKNSLEDAREFAYGYGLEYQTNQKAYLNNSCTLTDLYFTSRFDLVSTYLQSANVTLETTFQDRQITLNRIQQHLDNLYYWFSAQVVNTSLASGSLFWQRFAIHTPHLQLGDNSSSTGGGSVGVPMDEVYTFTDIMVEQYWEAIAVDLEKSRYHVGVGITSLMGQITEAKTYIDNFYSGNVISETFYGKNFLQVDIFYKELTERNIQQLKAYEYAALLGEVGGLMGLLLGASVLTLFELLDLIFYNSCVKCADHTKARKPKKVTPDEEKPYS